MQTQEIDKQKINLPIQRLTTPTFNTCYENQSEQDNSLRIDEDNNELFNPVECQQIHEFEEDHMESQLVQVQYQDSSMLSNFYEECISSLKSPIQMKMIVESNNNQDLFQSLLQQKPDLQGYKNEGYQFIFKEIQPVKVKVKNISRNYAMELKQILQQQKSPNNQKLLKKIFKKNKKILEKFNHKKLSDALYSNYIKKLPDQHPLYKKLKLQSFYLRKTLHKALRKPLQCTQPSGKLEQQLKKGSLRKIYALRLQNKSLLQRIQNQFN